MLTEQNTDTLVPEGTGSLGLHRGTLAEREWNEGGVWYDHKILCNKLNCDFPVHLKPWFDFFSCTLHGFHDVGIVIFCNAPLYEKGGYFFNTTMGSPWSFGAFKLYNSMRVEKMWGGDISILTFLCLLFGSLAARTGNSRDGFDFTLTDRRGMQNQLWGSSEANRQPCSTHEDPCDSCVGEGRKGSFEILICPYPPFIPHASPTPQILHIQTSPHSR